MTTLPETVSEYSIRAAESFLQTAVFVDDRIYEPASKTDESRKVIVPKVRKKATKTAVADGATDAERAQLEPGVDDTDASADTYEIVNYFAKKQIVCSLYQPKKTAQVTDKSEIFPLCKAADIVVIDWDLHGDKGKRAKELADGLIRQAAEDVPEQLRLLLVYTQELNLQAIGNELYETLKASLGDDFDVIDGEEGLAFKTENSRVVVLGKPGRDRPDQFKRFVVDEKKLADVAVEQFAKLASGILQAASLLGLAEIRKNSRKILSQFGADLDPAFLTHLGMSLPKEDASSHVIPLLVSEIEAVLEDALPRPLMPKNMLKDWCENVWTPGDHVQNLLGQQNLNLREIAKDICTEGFEKANENNGAVPKPTSSTKVRKAAKILLPSDDSDSNHRFSHLMAGRTFYGERQIFLTLGSIVRDKESNRYLLCIQPVCDCVRLAKARAFVFVEMKETNDSSSASHVVVRSDSPPLELIYSPKSYLSVTATFSPNQAAQKILAKAEENGLPYFEDTDSKKYHWIDQLRTAHAQRAVEKFASDLSRVGLTESEWLRRLDGN